MARELVTISEDGLVISFWDDGEVSIDTLNDRHNDGVHEVISKSAVQKLYKAMFNYFEGVV